MEIKRKNNFKRIFTRRILKKQNMDKEWFIIRDKLTSYFKICSCQRKLKTIVDNLYSIYKKCNDNYELGIPLDFTGTEWLIIAIMDKNTNTFSHGVNCEYPILNIEDDFWKWIIEIKDNPNLKDN